MTSAVPIDDGLFTWPSDEPQLIGSTCRTCGVVTFPRQASCPRCAGEDLTDRLLSRVGTLWSATVQHFPPPAPYVGPTPFEAYGVGYVELPDGVIVESRLTTAAIDRLRIGGAMELVIEAFAQRDDGTPLLTFAFAPSEVAP